LEIRELKSFQVVAKELNFRKAAETLGMSQPPLTRLISNLEASLGVRLFHRTTRKVELTGEGLYLYHCSREILEKMEALEKEIRNLKKINKQSMTIALHPAAIHSEIPKLISAFKLKFPGSNIDFIQIPGPQVDRKLLMGELDLAFGVQASKSQQLVSLEIHHQEMGLLISNNNYLSKKTSIKLSDLHGETLIFHGKDDHLGFQKEFEKYLRKLKIHAKIYYRKHGESCSELTEKNVGILITSKSMSQKSSKANFVPFSNITPKLKVYACWRREDQSNVLKALISFMQERQQVPSSEMDYHFN